MIRLFKIHQGVIREVDLDPQNLAEVRQAHWIDAYEPSEQERDILGSLLHIDLPESDDVEEIEASARYFVDQVGIHVHSLFLAASEGRHTTVSVACILQRERLITIRESDTADFRLLRMRARRGQVNSETPAELLVTLLEQKVENHADLLEDLHRQLEAVSYLVLEDEEADLEEGISRLARLEDGNGKVRLCLMDTQRNISFLLRHLKSEPEHIDTLREIMRDVETLMSHTTFLFDKINFLMDSTQGFINIEQNQIIKIFSIAAVVFLPPTLVASIYGMNFDHMPELQWLLGYPWALGLMVASGFAPYLYFKRKGWL
ncbi:MAG TPA: magnesium/cobalt transporter CorA [Pseudomonadales bacterium]